MVRVQGYPDAWTNPDHDPNGWFESSCQPEQIRKRSKVVREWQLRITWKTLEAFSPPETLVVDGRCVFFSGAISAIRPWREDGGYDVILKVCEALGSRHSATDKVLMLGLMESNGMFDWMFSWFADGV